MTSFSTYASRFLASGASAAPLPHHIHPSNPQRSLYRPYESSEYGSPFRDGQGGDEEEDDDEDDEAGDARDGVASRHVPQRTLPQLQPNQMSGSSRLLAQLTGRSSSKQKMGSIRDIDDEDGVEDDDSRMFRSQAQQAQRDTGVRGAHLSSILDDQSTPAASMYARDDQDPFLADTDVKRDSSKSRAGAPSSTSRKPSVDAKSKGWMAHAADSSSNASTSSYRGTPKRTGRRSMPDDIYRDPDELDDEDGVRHTRMAQKSKGKSRERQISESGISSDDDDATSVASSTDDESRYNAQATPGKAWRAGKREPRKDKDLRGGSASSLRQPLLSLAGSEALQDQPPGAYKGATSQLAAADIYAYPHPPAQSGWTPWAPGNHVPLSQYKDKAGLVGWLGLCAGTLLVAGWMAIEARSTAPPSSPSTRPSPYYTLTRSIPILFLLTFLSVAAAIANLFILRNLSRVGGAAIIRNGLIGIPLLLCAGWMWAFASSFIYDDEKWSGGGWSTTGLRILSIIPLALAVYFARSVWKRRDSISRSLAVLELSAVIVAKHPVLLLLSLASLGVFIAVSAPFLTIFVRLFLRGHLGSPSGPSNVWHTDPSARMMAWLTMGAWIWTWLVLRGIQRVTVAGVVSHWYFHRRDEDGSATAGDANDKLFDASRDDDDDDDEGALPGPAPGQWLGEEQISLAPPSHVDIVRASFIRATGSALGTVCLAALMLSLARVGTSIAATARWTHRKMTTSSRLPGFLHPLTHLVALLAGISALLQGLSDYALVYVGVTGDGFAAAARRSTRLTSKQSVKTVMEGMVINTLLDLTTLAFCFLAGLAGFLISAHNLHVPADAPLVGLLCAFLPYGLLRLCADVLSNAADTLYLCFSIDEASGEQHCKQASDAFLSTDEQLPF